MRERRPPRGSGEPPRKSEPPRRSDAAIPVAVVLLLVGLVVAHYSLLIPALLGIGLFLTAGSFVSTRLNPLSIGFYLTVKPSWRAIGVVFLIALALLATAYYEWAHGAPLWPSGLP